MLELKNITVIRNKKKILNNINLKFDDATMVAFTGANGSGKSTLMKVIMGIEKVDAGQIIYNGQDITNASITTRANLGISFAFQQPVKFKGLTISNLFEYAAKQKLEKKTMCKVLTTLGLCPSEYLDRELDSTLSGGELKRLEIASIMLKKSGCIILDEPEAGIDLWSFNRLIKVFQNIKEEQNPLFIIVSHQEKLLKIADRIIILEGGEVVKDGKAQDILKEVQ